MNQKRFLTLLPIMFIIVILCSILVSFAFYQVDKYGCIGNRIVKDEGQGIEFTIDCQWKVESNVNLEEDTYKILLKNQTATIEITRIKNDEMIVSLNEGDRFLELDNGVKRFREEDASTYYYDGLDRLSGKQKFQFSVTPNEESIRYIDSLISKIMN